MTNQIITEFLIAHNIPLPDGGVTRWTLHDDETLTRTDSHIPMDNPMWIVLNGNQLGAVTIESAGGELYAEYDLTDGTKLGQAIPTLGRVVCHFTGDGHDLYFANYSDGSVSRSHCGEVVRIEHTGQCGPNPNRQERPHVHQCILSPDKKYVLVCDLGLDRVFIYDDNLQPISEARFPDRCGPRHLCFSADGRYAYCANEPSSTVSVLSCDGENGTMAHLTH